MISRGGTSLDIVRVAGDDDVVLRFHHRLSVGALRMPPTDLLSVTALSNALLTLHCVACRTRIMSLLASTAVIDAQQIILGRAGGVELR